MVSNHGDRKSPKWGYGTPYKWQFYGSYMGVIPTTYVRPAMILQEGARAEEDAKDRPDGHPVVPQSSSQGGFRCEVFFPRLTKPLWSKYIPRKLHPSKLK